ncbi:MAG TPA: DUF305 domain-containing protein [Thermoanaerobaculia bacterium]|jgi:hypothetical protein|nr:DUF305 domain-containing protein [Thermoanaerobaculia bacterium]
MSEHNQHAQHGSTAGSKGMHHYRRLLVMMILSFIAMYILMYAMVDRFANVYTSFNQFYMAGLMTAAMLVIELGVMSGMYPDRKLNAILLAVGIIALGVFWFFIREQTRIADRQFLESMIPHHAGAILMCNESSLKDAELQKLCREIVLGQQQEIDQMTAKLRELDQ